MERYAELKARLAPAELDKFYNDFLAERDRSNSKNDESDSWYDAIPHIGFWRSLCFAALRFQIGQLDDGRAAICEKRKWEIEYRLMTESEALRFVDLIDDLREAIDPDDRIKGAEQIARVGFYVLGLQFANAIVEAEAAFEKVEGSL